MNDQFTIPDHVYMTAEDRDTGAGTYVRTLSKYLPAQSGGAAVASYSFNGLLSPAAPGDLLAANFFPDYANDAVWVVERYVNDDRVVRHLDASLTEDATITYLAGDITNPNDFAVRDVTEDGTIVIFSSGLSEQVIFISSAAGGTVSADVFLDGSADDIAPINDANLNRVGVTPLGRGDTVFIERSDNSWYALNSVGERTPELDPTGFGGAVIRSFTAIDQVPYFRTSASDGTFFTVELRNIAGAVVYSYTIPVAGKQVLGVLYKYAFYIPDSGTLHNLIVVDMTTGIEVFNSADIPAYDGNMTGADMALLSPTVAAFRAAVDVGGGLTQGTIFVDLTTGSVTRVIGDHYIEAQSGISKYVVFEDFGGHQVHDAVSTITLADPPGIFNESILPVSGRYKVFSAAAPPPPTPPFWTALNRTEEVI